MRARTRNLFVASCCFLFLAVSGFRAQTATVTPPIDRSANPATRPALPADRSGAAESRTVAETVAPDALLTRPDEDGRGASAEEEAREANRQAQQQMQAHQARVARLRVAQQHRRNQQRMQAHQARVARTQAAQQHRRNQQRR